MTDQPDTIAIRAQMETLDGYTPGPWGYRPNELDDWGDVRGGDGFRICQARDRRYMSDEYLSACRTSKVDPWEENARLIAAAPDMRETILALCAEVDRLNAAIIRQAGAAKTLRESTLAEVQYLKDKDRSEYHAAASLDSERKANELLTDENERLRSLLSVGCDLMAIEVEALKCGISINDEMRPGPEDQNTVDAINELEGWIYRAGRAALAQKGGE